MDTAFLSPLVGLGALNSGHCIFEPTVHTLFILGLLHISVLPIRVNGTFSLGVTAEVLRAIIGSKSAISLQRQPVDPEFQVEGVAPTNRSFSQKTIG